MGLVLFFGPTSAETEQMNIESDTVYRNIEIMNIESGTAELQGASEFLAVFGAAEKKAFCSLLWA